MKITLENVGNIKIGTLKLDENKLNIKYGINGAGKSTLANAIHAKINKQDLSKLKTYGLEVEPKVTIDFEPEKSLSFNREYVRDFLFKDDIANNSFEIMINSDLYQMTKKNLENGLVDLSVAVSSSELSMVEMRLYSFINSVDFNKPKNGRAPQISGKSKYGKAMGSFNISEQLSQDILSYKDNFNDLKSPEWYEWFKTGKEYIHNNICPFCATALSEDFYANYDKVLEISNHTTLKNSQTVKKAFNDFKLVAKFPDELNNITNSNQEMNDYQLTELKQIKDTYSVEKEKIEHLKKLNPEFVRDLFEKGCLKDYLEKNKLTEKLFDVQDRAVHKAIKTVNKQIDEQIKGIESLTRLAENFSKNISENVKNSEDEVNELLKMSGIPYTIEVRNENGKYKTILKPFNCDAIVDNNALSYGERNAIALVLFSLEAKKSNGLIILDDPVSSFDNNKKYALFYYLFIKDNAPLKGKTVLLLTHDFNIVYDFFFKGSFRNLKPKVFYYYNDFGLVNELIIKRKHLHHIVQYYLNRAQNVNLNVLSRVVYLRKYIELVYGEKSLSFDLLSSLEHRRGEPIKRNEKEEIPLTIDEKSEAMKKINEVLPNFDYYKILEDINDENNLKKWYNETASDVEKLQLARSYSELAAIQIENANIFNFITETYHIEDNFVVLLDENKFNQLPRYVIECLNDIMN